LTEPSSGTGQPLEPNPEGAAQQISELKLALEKSRAATQSAERKAELASKAVEDVERFSYGLAHDLRSSLRRVLSFAQLLERKLPDDPEFKEFMGHILGGAGDMQFLIDSVQKLANIPKQSGRSHFRLDVLVQLAMLRLDKALKASRASVQFANLPEVLVNESLFIDLFEQLISNSIRYCGEKVPQIEIRSEEDSDFHTISVKDNGPGIAPQYQQSIFEPFKTLHGGKISGVGLGLTLSQKIVEAHAGKLWVESDGKSGSIFRFTIPV
jgi:light-regulated signal transduction histidine kinase (bacteriophytochrome)